MASHAQQIHQGLAIILAREADTSVDIHDDVLYAGTAAGPYTAEERTALEALGWYVDEDSWAYST